MIVIDIYKLRALKKELIIATTPTREKELALALKTILMDSCDMMHDEAMKVLKWDKCPIVKASNISISETEGYPPVVIARGCGVPEVEGALIINIVKASEDNRNIGIYD